MLRRNKGSQGRDSSHTKALCLPTRPLVTLEDPLIPLASSALSLFQSFDLDSTCTLLSPYSEHQKCISISDVVAGNDWAEKSHQPCCGIEAGVDSFFL